MPTKDDPARLAAYRTLRAVSADDAYANLVLPRQLAAAGLTGRDAGLATELGYGSLRARGVLDEVLRRCSSRELAEIEPAVLDLLRLGAYQLLKTRIPTHAAVATTVDLARTTGNGRAAGFVNAVLRRVAARDFEGWCAEIGADASPRGRLALRYSHPGWIVAAFAEALAEDGVPADGADAELERALAADDARPETHLVGWPGLIDRAELAEQASGTAGPYSPYAVRLTSGGEPAALPAVRSGLAAVQDEGSQLCALALTELPLTGPDVRWLDLCAGPGGKTALLAALAAGRGAGVTANELHPHRAELVAAATGRWPVEILVGDARELTGRYDRVLLDAPCTGLGRAAPPAGGSLAANPGRPGRADRAAGRAVGRRGAADPARRSAGLRHLLAASGRNPRAAAPGARSASGVGAAGCPAGLSGRRPAGGLADRAAVAAPARHRRDVLRRPAPTLGP